MAAAGSPRGRARHRRRTHLRSRGRAAVSDAFVLVLVLVLAACRGSASIPPIAVRGDEQRYALSCEACAAVSLLAVYGIAVDEDVFLAGLPRSDNPDLGFVGDVEAAPGELPPAGYGVHAEPVAGRLRALGLDVRAERGRDAGWLRARLRERKPVLAWVTSDFVAREPVVLHDRAGRAFRAVRWEHAVLVVAADATGVRLFDPALGAVRAVPWPAFLAAWRSLDGMAVVTNVPAPGASNSVDEP